MGYSDRFWTVVFWRAGLAVDDYEGSVDMHIFDEDDPLIQVWDRIFPGLFKTSGQMDPTIKNHIREKKENTWQQRS